MIQNISDDLLLRKLFASSEFGCYPTETTKESNAYTGRKCFLDALSGLPRPPKILPTVHDAVFNPELLAEGAFRDVREGMVAVNGVDREDSQMLGGWHVEHTILDLGPGAGAQGCKAFARCVVKAFKKSPPGGTVLAAGAELHALERASQLAAEFNKSIKPSVPVEFIEGFLYQDKWVDVKQSKNREIEGDSIYLIEPKLESYCKMNSNTGWVVQLDSVTNQITQAFSHWTWASTDGACLVCDIQGMVTDERILLTDPVIHTSSSRTMLTDLGKHGMRAFFQSHTCNEFCAHLGKPSKDFMVKYAGAPAPVQRTTFWYEALQISAAIHNQEKSTCYAHAAATLIRAAEGRIIGRKEKLQPHHELVLRIVKKHGVKGGFLKEVLREFCPVPLRFKLVDVEEAKQAVQKGHAVGIVFHWTKEQWDAFSNFFAADPAGILTTLPKTTPTSDLEGHAMVILSCFGNAWELKNSWGTDFAEGGKCKISVDVFGKSTQYFHVFWLENELTEEDKKAYLDAEKKKMKELSSGTCQPSLR